MLNEITPMHVGAAIGILLILLGWVALLAQRIYIDPRTNAASEIEVPILGKMKANYPALVFVFLGCVVIALGFTQYKGGVRTNRWLIDGSIISDTKGRNWQRGHLAVFPASTKMGIDPETAAFSIELDIEEPKTFEDVIERIQYTHPDGNMLLYPKIELDLKSSGKQSKLLETTPKSRRYAAPLEPMPKVD